MECLLLMLTLTQFFSSLSVSLFLLVYNLHYVYHSVIISSCNVIVPLSSQAPYPFYNICHARVIFIANPVLSWFSNCNSACVHLCSTVVTVVFFNFTAYIKEFMIFPLFNQISLNRDIYT